MSKVVNVEVIARGNMSSEALIKKFSRAVEKSGIIQEIRERRYYQKPSDVKRKERIRRKKLIKKNNQEDNKVVKGNRD